MFRLSKGAEYAIRGILYMSIEEGRSSHIEEISSAQDVPPAYLSKIFQTLSRKGFIRSRRGPKGGFTLLRDANNLTLLEVIEAMEGPIHLNECLIHKGFCDRDALCPVHEVWKATQKKFLDCLRLTFRELAESAVQKEKTLKLINQRR